jgi:hypothetical protein
LTDSILLYAVPRKERQQQAMAQSAASLQDELNQALDDIAEVKSTLDDAYTPEADRADLAKAIGEALEILYDYNLGEDEDEEEDED